jgi:branched-chain amino acid transport system substrate-binding protein
MQKSRLARALSAIAVTFALACGRNAGGVGDEIKIVSSMPRTGSANAQTTSMVNGIRMALDEAGPTIAGKRVVYEDWDDASARKGDWDPEVEASNAHRAVTDPSVLAYIGTYNSGAAKISMPVLNKARIPMISPANTYTGLTKPGLGEPGEPDIYRPAGIVSYFRVVPADDLQGRVAAEWIRDLDGKTVYVLDDRSLYGKGVADVFAVSGEQLGLRVLGREGIDPKAQEYRSLMAKIRELDPDWIYFGGTTQTNAGQVAKDMVAVGLRSNMMVPDGCFEDAFIEAAGAKVVEGRVFVTFGGVPPDALTGKGAQFVAAYKKRFGTEPQAYAVYGYVAAQVALDGIARAPKLERDAVRKAVAEPRQTDGPLGTWSFDENGDTSNKLFSGSQVKDGEFTFVQVLGG